MSDTSVILQEAKANISAKKWSVALAMLQKIYQDDSKKHDVEIYDLLSTCYMKNYDAANSLKIIKQGFLLHPENLAIGLKYARFLFNKDKSIYQSVFVFEKVFNVDRGVFLVQDLLDFRTGIYLTGLFYDIKTELDDLIAHRVSSEFSGERKVFFDFKALVAKNDFEAASQILRRVDFKKIEHRLKKPFFKKAIEFLLDAGFYQDLDQMLRENLWAKDILDFERLKGNVALMLQVDRILLAECDGYRIIQYKRKDSLTSKVIITFGILGSHKRTEPFGLYFLLKHGYDVIWVAQAARSSYSLLSFNDFGNILAPQIKNYQGVFTYGSSLGGYAAIYYAGAVDATVIASTPLFSGHPVFHEIKGGKRRRFKVKPIQHEKLTSKPVFIIRDPMVEKDMFFYEHVINPAYPEAEILDLPHVGHGAVISIQKASKLKDLILTLIEELRFLDIEGDVKKTGRFYYNKAMHSFFEKKFEFALADIEQSMQIEPTATSFELKSKILIELGERERALAVLKDSLAIFPKSKNLTKLKDDYIKTNQAADSDFMKEV